MRHEFAALHRRSSCLHITPSGVNARGAQVIRNQEDDWEPYGPEIYIFFSL
jgi:hypothetical protein